MSDAIRIRNSLMRNAPSVVAQDDKRAAQNTEVEELYDAEQPTAPEAAGQWRPIGAGIFERDNPQRGGVETIINEDGNVYAKFTPKKYDPPPLRTDRSAAQLLLTDIPKREETMFRLLVNGDIDAAEQERTRIDEFIDAERPLLMKVSRYSGSDEMLKGLSQRAMKMVTGAWVSEDAMKMFTPGGNPRYRDLWARQAGANQTLTEVLKRAELDRDPAAMAELAAATTAIGGMPDGVVVGQVANAGGGDDMRSARGGQGTSVADLGGYLDYARWYAPNVLPEADPAAAAGVLKHLYGVGDATIFRGGLAGIVHDESRGDYSKAKGVAMRITNDWLPAWAAGAEGNDSISHQRQFTVAVNSARDYMASLGGGGSVERANASVTGMLRQVSEVVAASAEPLDAASVARVARIYMAKALNREVPAADASLAAELTRADRALAGITVSTPAYETDLPLITERVKDTAGTIQTYQRQQTADELYPAFAGMKNAMAGAMKQARADVVSGKYTDVVEAISARARSIEDLIVIPPALAAVEEQSTSSPDAARGESSERVAAEKQPEPSAVRKAASELILKLWATDSDGQFDVRGAYSELARRYKDVLESAEIKQNAVGGEPVVATASEKAAAPQPRTALADLRAFLTGERYNRISSTAGGTVTVEASDGGLGVYRNTGADIAPGDAQINQVILAAEKAYDWARRESCSPTSPAMTFLLSKTVGELKGTTRPGDAVSTKVFETLFKLVAGELRAKLDPILVDQVIGKDAVDSMATKLASSLIDEVLAWPGVPELISGSQRADAPPIGDALSADDRSRLSDGAVASSQIPAFSSPRPPLIAPNPYPRSIPPPYPYHFPQGEVGAASRRIVKFLALGNADAKEIPGDGFREPKRKYNLAMRTNVNALYAVDPLPLPAEEASEQSKSTGVVEGVQIPPGDQPPARAAAPQATIDLLDPSKYSVIEMKEALRAVDATSKAYSRPVEDRLIATILGKIPPGLTRVRQFATSAVSANPAITVETTRLMIGRLIQVEQARAAAAERTDRLLTRAADAEFKKLEEQTKPDEFGNAGIDDAEFQRQLSAVIKKYIPPPSDQ